MKVFICFFFLFPIGVFSQFKIAFGSCADQRKNLSIFDSIAREKPDLFIFLGDNIYVDSKNEDTFSYKYEQLFSNSSFQHLQKQTKIIATWDDHDYGQNDAGKEFSEKELSKTQFLSYFKDEKTKERKKHAGIYCSYFIKYKRKKIQVILLDTRTFRDSLCLFTGQKDSLLRFSYWPQYAPCEDSSKTMLGKEQWVWLENQLDKKAHLRIICSSNQVLHGWNGHESWNNLPYEKEKLLQLIQSKEVRNLFFLSGDVHFEEISLENKTGFPLYDFTSSGLTNSWHEISPNEHRVGKASIENNFGLIEINEKDKQWQINVQILSKELALLQETLLLLKNAQIR